MNFFHRLVRLVSSLGSLILCWNSKRQWLGYLRKVAFKRTLKYRHYFSGCPESKLNFQIFQQLMLSGNFQVLCNSKKKIILGIFFKSKANSQNLSGNIDPVLRVPEAVNQSICESLFGKKQASGLIILGMLSLKVIFKQ